MRENAKFPTEVWDGLSKNEDRDDRRDDIAPDFHDWDQMTAEVIAIEETVANIDELANMPEPPGANGVYNLQVDGANVDYVADTYPGSAAAGIDANDVSNWDGKLDANDVTNLATTTLPTEANTYIIQIDSNGDVTFVAHA